MEGIMNSQISKLIHVFVIFALLFPMFGEAATPGEAAVEIPGEIDFFRSQAE
jgi:hypothetical protein